MNNKRVVIINRHYPPNPGITGESAWDLAKYLIVNHQIEVSVVHMNHSDDGGGQIREPIGEIYSLSSFYSGNNKYLKLLAGLLDGYSLVQKAKKIAKQAPIICMTSPPLLPFWASIFLRERPWAFWSMDLFPEAFVAIGMIGEKNIFYRWALKQTYRQIPQKLIALGKKQADFIQKKYQKEVSKIILPCGVIFHQVYEKQAPIWRKNDDKIYFGYIGNLNDAHNADFLMEFITSFNPQKHHLILALYGKKVAKVLELAKNFEGITILAHVPRSQLNFIDVHLVSLLTKYTHLMIPSKAVSAIAAGGTMLFCGSPESDNWDMLQEAAWLIDENADLSTQINQFLDKINLEELNRKKQKSIEINKNLQKTVLNAYEEIANFIKQ